MDSKQAGIADILNKRNSIPVEWISCKKQLSRNFKPSHLDIYTSLAKLWYNLAAEHLSSLGSKN
jgi:hypothetical protein